MASIAPYGSWRSPVSAALVSGEALGLGQIVLDAGRVYWSEQRPREQGRNVIVRATPNGPEDLLPPPFSARSRVHEYGGGAFSVANGELYFCHDLDQRVYRLAPGAGAEPLTPEGPSRYADLAPDLRRGRLVCVCERHAAGHEPHNSLVAVDCGGRRVPQELVAGHDFYSAPRLAPDGRRLAWLTWNHPNMPWDGTELWLADVGEDGTLADPRRVAGGPQESITQPRFAPDGSLYFVSDRSDWWNLYRWRDGQVEPVLAMAAEFAAPPWVFGQSNYAFLSAHAIACAVGQEGRWRLGLLDSARAVWTPCDMPYSEIGQLCAADGRAYFIGAAPDRVAEVVELDVGSGHTRVLARASDVALDPGFLSIPQAVSYPTEGGARAHAFYYAPCNRDFAPPPTEQAPLLVLSHGGPTAATASALNLRVQFFTSRGFAVLDVNYRGSSGYGRAYRRALDGQWGVADVLDCIAGARHLVRAGHADPARLLIRGSSAGGYTTLCALVFHDAFRAGASYYGISDLEALARDTHKFEAHYLDRLIGPYPEQRARYQARSPVHHVARLARPTIFFQGQLDKVVPPDQTECMVAALRARGVAVAYVSFDNEAHGFRRADNIARALEAELSFYARVLGFTPAEGLAPLAIDNL